MNISELYLDYTDEELASLENDELIEIIKALRKENDDLKGIRRTSEGEIIVSDDEVIQDDEEVIT